MIWRIPLLPVVGSALAVYALGRTLPRMPRWRSWAPAAGIAVVYAGIVVTAVVVARGF